MGYNSRFLQTNSMEVVPRCTCGHHRWAVFLRTTQCHPISEGELHERCRTSTRCMACRNMFLRSPVRCIAVRYLSYPSLSSGQGRMRSSWVTPLSQVDCRVKSDRCLVGPTTLALPLLRIELLVPIVYEVLSKFGWPLGGSPVELRDQPPSEGVLAFSGYLRFLASVPWIVL